MRQHRQSQRGNSYDDPRQSNSSTRMSPMDAVMHMGGYDSPSDYSDSPGDKQSPPPLNASMLAFLREQQFAAMEPRGATMMAAFNGEDAVEYAGDAEHVRQERLRVTKRRTKGSGNREGPSHTLDDSFRAMDGAKSLKSSTSTSPSTADTESAPTHGVKRSRYLREVDRRTIIRRIDNGEKQAALAKEFGVTRAAICHIKKNRAEILMRSSRADVHSAARHPKRGMYSTSKSSQFHNTAPSGSLGDYQTPMVYEVRSAALTMLLTTLRRKETVCRDYRLASDRAFRLLLEEALASAPTRTLEILTTHDSIFHGVTAEQPSCAIVMGESGYPMLEAFRSIQPDSPTGFMTLEQEDSNDLGGAQSPPRVVLRKLCAPPDLRGHSLFLLGATCANSDDVVVAIQSLLDFGAHESTIFFVPLVVSACAVAEICDRFPSVRIVCAAIDPDVESDGTMRPGIGSFQERYFNTTTIRQTHFGANVQL